MEYKIAKQSSVPMAARFWKVATGLSKRSKLMLLAALLLLGVFLVYTSLAGAGLAKLLDKAGPASLAQTLFKDARLERDVRTAWQRLSNAGQYDFSTTIEQITYPAPKLTNVGESSTRDLYHISGRADVQNHKLLVSLWQNSGSVMNSQDGLEIKIEEGKAWGRTIGAEWQPIDSFSVSSFAPGNDAASFLASARNVRLKEYIALDMSPVEGKTTQFKSAHYTFDMDSNRYATYMRDQMAAELQRAGKLPAGMHLNLSDEYRKMVGSGEVWVGEDGLPLRMTIKMKFPPTKSGERVEAHLSTDFFVQPIGSQQAASLYPLGLLGKAARAITFDTMAWLTTAGSDSSQVIPVVFSMGIVLVFAAGLLLSRRDLKNSYIYRLVACLVILSTLITPLWDGARAQQYSRFNEGQSQKQAAQEQSSARQQEAIEQAFGMDWNPQLSPYAQVDPEIALDDKPVDVGKLMAPVNARNASPLASEPGGGDADSDMDGLTDAYESLYDVTILNPNDADTDDDSLNDGEEVKLGLAPGKQDTDNDRILDIDEVQSWYGYDQYWWTDPTSKDTDKDGVLDGLECPERVAPISSRVCRDTDGDKIPDVFDTDDDGDGVPTVVDVSAYAVDTSVYSQSNPFKMTVSDLASDEIFVTYQLMPSNPEHLTFSMNVLDWPSGDTDAQIMRISETTFKDQLPPDKAAGDPKADKGDMRLIPMLEVKLTGPTLPLQLTDWMTVTVPKAEGSSVDFNGIVRLTAQSGSTLVTLQDAPSGTYPILQAEGSCNDVTAPRDCRPGEGSSATASGVSLGAFAQGDRVLMVLNSAQTEIIGCTVVPAVAHANLTNQVVDGSLLSNYGAFARNDTDDSVLLYAPLSLVYDTAGGSPIAFQSKLPYTNAGGRMNGAHQEVRAVWLLQMLTDVCKPRPEDFTGEWCSTAASAENHWINRPGSGSPDL